MDKLKVLVVEDEIIIADNICDTLEELGYDPLEPEVNFTQAIASIENEMPDIAILDIQLSGSKTGINIAEEINNKYHFPFIFLTSNSDKYTVSEAKKVNPSAYLVKPFTKEELFTTIEIAIHNFARRKNNNQQEDLILKNAFFVKVKGTYNKVNFSDIVYIKGSHVYIELFMKNKKKYVVRKTLSDVLNSLNSFFIRVQRSYIVNLQYLDEVTQNSVIVNSTEIPVGKKYKKDILRVINTF